MPYGERKNRESVLGDGLSDGARGRKSFQSGGPPRPPPGGPGGGRRESRTRQRRAARLAELKGVGKGLAAAIGEYLETGTVKEYEKLKSAYPEGLLELRDVPGLGPKRIKTLYDELEISSLAELEYAVSENRLVELKGFGAKTQAKIQEALVHLKANRGRMLLPRALDRSLDIRAALAKLHGVKRAEET